MGKLLTEEALAEVGKVSEGGAGLVTAKDIAKFCSGILDQSPEHFDRAAARDLGYPDQIAPPTFVQTTTRPSPPRSGYMPDGQFGTVAPPGLQHLQTMLGGQSWILHRPALVGETIVERRKVLSMEERESKTGPMVIVRSEQSYSDADDKPIETLVSTLIVRTPPPPLAGNGEDVAVPEPSAQAVPEDAPDRLVVETDMIQAYLFNASIWAVHRIHWDVPYARSEGLPSVLLVGWNLANFAARLGRRLAPDGQRLHRLDLSYRAMAHPGDVLTVNAGASLNDGGREVTIVNGRGPTNAMGSMGWIEGNGF